MRRKIALAITADGEVDLIRGMIELLLPQLDRVLIVEGRRTFQGKPREIFGEGWLDLLALKPEQFRSVVTDLPDDNAPSASMRQREMLQRNAIGLGVRDMQPDDLLIAVDADEFVDPDWLDSHADSVSVPTRMFMLPCYGGLDRRAPDWHCCLKHLTTPVGDWPPHETGWLFPGGVIAPIRDLANLGVQYWRSHPVAKTDEVAGWHLLHLLSPEKDPSRKLQRQAHDWDLGADCHYMIHCLAAGIHPYGWWGATQIAVPSQLEFLARRHPDTVLGDLPSLNERHHLMQEALERFHNSSHLKLSSINPEEH
ncbi:MAG: hypothetical protein FDX21_03870 [Chlorobium sp.]|nr:MAG: hypothetical protein FDX21_03870 [Chlorobium sp.]